MPGGGAGGGMSVVTRGREQPFGVVCIVKVNDEHPLRCRSISCVHMSEKTCVPPNKIVRQNVG
jgi:hypothetical protein